EGRHVEYMTYPRGCALAEVFWSPPADRDYSEFEARLENHLTRLRVLDVSFRPPAAEPEPVGTWVVEAGKGEKTCQWDCEPAAGRNVVAFAPQGRGVPFEVVDLVVESEGAAL